MTVEMVWVMKVDRLSGLPPVVLPKRIVPESSGNFWRCAASPEMALKELTLPAYRTPLDCPTGLGWLGRTSVTLESLSELRKEVSDAVEG